MNGLDGWYAAFLLDRAVTWFGRYVENKLMERDRNGKPVHTLEALLRDADEAPRSDLHALVAALGGSARVVRG
jgi:hypothetical protein